MILPASRENLKVVLLTANRLLAGLLAATSTLLIAEWFGADAASRYFASIAATALLGVLLRWGILQTVVRAVVTAGSIGEKRQIAGAFLAFGFISSIVSGSVIFAAVGLLVDGHTWPSRMMAACFIALETVRLICAEVLRSFNKQDWAILPGEAGRNLVFLFLVASTHSSRGEMIDLLAFYALATGASALVGALTVVKIVRPVGVGAKDGLHLLVSWSRTLTSITVTEISQVWIFQAPVLLLTIFVEPFEAVQIAVALRAAQLILVPLTVLVQYAAPRIVLTNDRGPRPDVRVRYLAGMVGIASTACFLATVAAISVLRPSALTLELYLPAAAGALVSSWCGTTGAAMNLIGYAVQNTIMQLSASGFITIWIALMWALHGPSWLATASFGATLAALNLSQAAYLTKRGVRLTPQIRLAF